MIAPHLRFRTKLLVGMMLLVLILTAFGLFLAQRKVSLEAELNLKSEFQNELAAMHRVQEVRHAALAERCRLLVRRPRIHAALEDNALDLLYLSARDELRDIMSEDEEASSGGLPHTLRATFYRFLDSHGTVISPPGSAEVGELSPEEEARLSLPRAPESQQLGYLVRKAGDGAPMVDEIIAMPIVSTESGETIAALVLGFKPVEPGFPAGGAQTRAGILVDGKLLMPGISPAAQTALSPEVERATSSSEETASSFPVRIDGEPHLLSAKKLNPDSLFPAAFEVVIYPLAGALAWQERLRSQVLWGGAALLLAGMLACQFLAARLSRPVEKLEVDSLEDRAQRERAELALETTSSELQRAARFSADASHQLKTPVTVLRAGLEELLAQEELGANLREEISALVHQTFRLTNIVDDLLLLSRMEAGRLEISFVSVDLMQLIEILMDDLTALPEALEVGIEADGPDLKIAGEKRYVSLILQNLLENARKYNRPGGRIRIGCRKEGEWALVAIANTGRAISAAAQEHIFERFHRGTSGENIPGHGLGLNLARELARLHGGELRLARSDEKWTEFEVRFRVFPHSAGGEPVESRRREAAMAG